MQLISSSSRLRRRTGWRSPLPAIGVLTVCLVIVIACLPVSNAQEELGPPAGSEEAVEFLPPAINGPTIEPWAEDLDDGRSDSLRRGSDSSLHEPDSYESTHHRPRSGGAKSDGGRRGPIPGRRPPVRATDEEFDISPDAPLDFSAETGAEDSDAPRSRSRRLERIEERYPNGAIKIVRHVYQDDRGNFVPHGSWRLSTAEGGVTAEGNYRDGKPDGTWTRWLTAEQAKTLAESPYKEFTPPFISEATFRGGMLDGKWTIYDSKQRAASEISFQSGQRQGRAIWRHANGKPARELTFRGGIAHGSAKSYDASGKLLKTLEYREGRLVDQQIDHFGKKDRKKSETTMLRAPLVVEKPDDWWHTRFATYKKQGQDERHGKWVVWYPNGIKQAEGTFDHGKPAGDYAAWHDNGQKKVEGEYLEGRKHGSWVWWHANGQKSIQGDYDHGNATGRWVWWKESGRVAQQLDMNGRGGQVPVSTPFPATEAGSRSGG